MFITLVVLAAGHYLGGIPGEKLATGVGPLWIAALGIGLFNALFSGSNADPTLPVAFTLGPFHVTWAALAAGAGLAARVIAIASVGVVFAQTTDSTRLVDALVQQARVPERFAYGALAAYQAIPRLGRAADDAAPGAADPRACDGRGTHGSWWGCLCSPSATATGWRSRWTRGRSGRGRGRATAWCAGRGSIPRSG